MGEINLTRGSSLLFLSSSEQIALKSPLLTLVLVPLQFRRNNIESLINLFSQFLKDKYIIVSFTFPSHSGQHLNSSLDLVSSIFLLYALACVSFFSFNEISIHCAKLNTQIKDFPSPSSSELE